MRCCPDQTRSENAGNVAPEIADHAMMGKIRERFADERPAILPDALLVQRHRVLEHIISPASPAHTRYSCHAMRGMPMCTLKVLSRYSAISITVHCGTISEPVIEKIGTDRGTRKYSALSEGAS